MDLSEMFTTHSCHYAGPCASLTSFPGRKNSKFRHSVTVCEPPTSQKVHLHFFTFSCPVCPCAGSKPKKSPEAAMGGGIGPLNAALESATTATKWAFSRRFPQTEVHFWTCLGLGRATRSYLWYNIQCWGPPQQAISTALLSKSRISSKTGKDYHSHSTSA